MDMLEYYHRIEQEIKQLSYHKRNIDEFARFEFRSLENVLDRFKIFPRMKTQDAGYDIHLIYSRYLGHLQIYLDRKGRLVVKTESKTNQYEVEKNKDAIEILMKYGLNLK